MTDMSREDLLQIVREAYDDRDPVPSGLVARMQAAAAVAAADLGGGLDLELMLLIERSGELAGARGTTSYTLRFVHGDTDLLLRIAPEGGTSDLDDGAATARVDGWIVPPESMTVRALREDRDVQPGAQPAVISESGRFELTGLLAGLLRLRFEPHDTTRAAFATPTFEI